MPRSIPILELDPRWLERPGRYGVGISMQCPRHRGDCRLSFYFARPYDGFPPIQGVRLHHHLRGGLQELTLYGLGHDHVIDVPGHWTGYIYEGRVFTVRPLRNEDAIETDPAIPALPDPGPSEE
jgi:hypothetical protein